MGHPQTEVLDQYSEDCSETEVQAILPPIDVDPSVIGIREAAFTWSKDVDGTVTPGRSGRNFALRIDDEITFKRGTINLIVGPTGSGKTSMLMALLGELLIERRQGQMLNLTPPKARCTTYHTVPSRTSSFRVRVA